jgi:hypothetical protein
MVAEQDGLCVRPLLDHLNDSACRVQRPAGHPRDHRDLLRLSQTRQRLISGRQSPAREGEREHTGECVWTTAPTCGLARYTSVCRHSLRTHPPRSPSATVPSRCTTARSSSRRSRIWLKAASTMALGPTRAERFACWTWPAGHESDLATRSAAAQSSATSWRIRSASRPRQAAARWAPTDRPRAVPS